MRPTVVLLLLLCIALPAQAAWPGFHNDARHSGFQSGTDYQAYRDPWWNVKIDPATQVDASPLVADGLVVAAGWDGVVRVLDAQTGASRWTATMSKIVGTPVIAGGVLFVVDTTGAVKSFDLDKGTPLYTAAVGQTYASLTFHEGKLFVGNEAGVMTAFLAETLTPLWTFAVNSISDGSTTSCNTSTPPVCTSTCKAVLPVGAIRGAPAVHDGKVIFGSMNTWVYAVAEQATDKSKAQWIFKTNDIIVGSPSVDGGTGRVFIGSYDEKVYALPVSPSGAGPITVGTAVCTALQNTPAWTFGVPAAQFGQKSKVESTPATDGSKIYFGANNGHVYAVYISNGTKAWEFETGAAVASSPAVANGLVVTGSDDGKVYWLSATDGTKTASYTMDSAVKASPALEGNQTFVASSEGSIQMLGQTLPKRPDLQVTGIVYDDGVVTVLVSNAGNGDAAASLLSLTIDGVAVDDLSVDAIAAGGSATVTLETKLAHGLHTVVATIDQAGAVKESAEGNNELTTPLDVPKSGGKKGIGLPGPAPALVILGLALLAVVRRRMA